MEQSSNTNRPLHERILHALRNQGRRRLDRYSYPVDRFNIRRQENRRVRRPPQSDTENPGSSLCRTISSRQSRSRDHDSSRRTSENISSRTTGPTPPSSRRHRVPSFLSPNDPETQWWVTRCITEGCEGFRASRRVEDVLHKRCRMCHLPLPRPIPVLCRRATLIDIIRTLPPQQGVGNGPS